jgi:hypothetical protein
MPHSLVEIWEQHIGHEFATRSTEQTLDTMVDELIASGTISDPGMVYFDIRPSAHLPTVELRVCDACPDVEDVVPTVATMAIGRRPAARSDAIASPSRSARISNRSLVGMRTRDARPRPRVMHALSIEEWASCEA